MLINMCFICLQQRPLTCNLFASWAQYVAVSASFALPKAGGWCGCARCFQLQEWEGVSKALSLCALGA